MLRNLLLLRALLRGSLQMPPVVRPMNGIGAFVYQIAKMNRRLTAMGSQQQGTITNAQGLPVINTGAVPGTVPQAYGFQLVDPDTQEQIGFFGLNGAGVACLQFWDGAGALTTVFDSTGQSVYDDTGTEQVHLGLVPGTGGNTGNPAVYGLSVLPSGGSALQLVAGYVRVAPVSVNDANTAGSWVAFSPNAVTVTVGPAQQARVNVGGDLSTGGANQVLTLGVAVDGGAPFPWLQVSSAAGAVNGQGGQEAIYENLPVGSHTFELYYKTQNDVGTASTSNVFLEVGAL